MLSTWNVTAGAVPRLLVTSKPVALTVFTPCPASRSVSVATSKSSSHRFSATFVGVPRVSPFTVIEGGEARSSSDSTPILINEFVAGRSTSIFSTGAILSVIVTGIGLVLSPERSLTEPVTTVSVAGPGAGFFITVKNMSLGSTAYVDADMAGVSFTRKPEATIDGTDIFSEKTTRTLVARPVLTVFATVSYHSPAMTLATNGGFWSEVKMWTWSPAVTASASLRPPLPTVSEAVTYQVLRPSAADGIRARTTIPDASVVVIVLSGRIIVPGSVNVLLPSLSRWNRIELTSTPESPSLIRAVRNDEKVCSNALWAGDNTVTVGFTPSTSIVSLTSESGSVSV